MATLKNTTINDTGLFKVPVGTTAERPSSPLLGDLRWNTTEGKFELYDGAAWFTFGVVNVIGTGGTLSTSGNFNTHTYTTVGNSTFEIVEQ